MLTLPAYGVSGPRATCTRRRGSPGLTSRGLPSPSFPPSPLPQTGVEPAAPRQVWPRSSVHVTEKQAAARATPPRPPWPPSPVCWPKQRTSRGQGPMKPPGRKRPSGKGCPSPPWCRLFSRTRKRVRRLQHGRRLVRAVLRVENLTQRSRSLRNC